MALYPWESQHTLTGKQAPAPDPQKLPVPEKNDGALGTNNRIVEVKVPDPTLRQNDSDG